MQPRRLRSASLQPHPLHATEPDYFVVTIRSKDRKPGTLVIPGIRLRRMAVVERFDCVQNLLVLVHHRMLVSKSVPIARTVAERCPKLVERLHENSRP